MPSSLRLSGPSKLESAAGDLTRLLTIAAFFCLSSFVVAQEEVIPPRFSFSGEHGLTVVLDHRTGRLFTFEPRGFEGVLVVSDPSEYTVSLRPLVTSLEGEGYAVELTPIDARYGGLVGNNTLSLTVFDRLSGAHYTLSASYSRAECKVTDYVRGREFSREVELNDRRSAELRQRQEQLREQRLRTLAARMRWVVSRVEAFREQRGELPRGAYLLPDLAEAGLVPDALDWWIWADTHGDEWVLLGGTRGAPYAPKWLPGEMLVLDAAGNFQRTVGYKRQEVRLGELDTEPWDPGELARLEAPRSVERVQRVRSAPHRPGGLLAGLRYQRVNCGVFDRATGVLYHTAGEGARRPAAQWAFDFRAAKAYRFLPPAEHVALPTELVEARYELAEVPSRSRSRGGYTGPFRQGIYRGQGDPAPHYRVHDLAQGAHPDFEFRAGLGSVRSSDPSAEPRTIEESRVDDPARAAELRAELTNAAPTQVAVASSAPSARWARLGEDDFRGRQVWFDRHMGRLVLSDGRAGQACLRWLDPVANSTRVTTAGEELPWEVDEADEVAPHYVLLGYDREGFKVAVQDLHSGRLFVADRLQQVSYEVDADARDAIRRELQVSEERSEPR
ncbi:hypothetical protein OAX78_02090 [Planctomycetota bacterium]|nr:hypothetical protein [Planctomycetota bacterium]